MKYDLPDNHCLSQSVLNTLVFREKEQPSLSDVQYAALEAGVGRGESLLVLSPTSTGKTHIALWAIARSLDTGGNTVYLVTHRALAKQKFEDFGSLLAGPFLHGDASGIVIATGDCIEDGNGNPPREPLRAPLLVATYEKYLAMLSASGIPTDMKATTIICDEIQLIGDAHRGQHVEVLLALLRNAGWGQFVGLSAVLEPRDATEIADWLGVKTVIQRTREKHLMYECWTSKGIAAVSSQHPADIVEGLALPDGVALDSVEILRSLLKAENPPVPIVVFCMRRQDTYDLPKQLLAADRRPQKGQLLLPFEELPETSANVFLSEIMAHRLALHNADLLEEERRIVEKHLLEGKLDAVFATSTLAAGVNFPLGAALFAAWQRWNQQRRCYEAIESSEFHNMAGRVGRMGYTHEQGRVIFFAKDHEIPIARQYLNLGALPHVESRITPERFDQLALQLVGSGLCDSRGTAEKLVCSTLSAQRELDRNPSSYAEWPGELSKAVDELVRQAWLIETSEGRLCATPGGKALAQSGLLPSTGVFLLKYVSRRIHELVRCLPAAQTPGDMHRLAFLLFSACFASPEFRRYAGKNPTRFIPYHLDRMGLCDASAYRDDLVEPAWEADVMPVNAAKFCCDWIEGTEVHQMEEACPGLSAGMIRDMSQNLVWVLQGLASIVTAASDVRLPDACRPEILRRTKIKPELLARLPRAIRRLSFRASEGLPDDVLWMTSLRSSESEFNLSRADILHLRTHGLSTPEQIMQGTQDADKARVAAFGRAKPTPQAKANWLRDTCRNWKVSERKKAAERHLRRAQRCKNRQLVERYYSATGTDFEKTFEDVLTVLGISFEKLDDRSKTGAPDYMVHLKDSHPLIVELKSSGSDKLIDYNKAVEVLSASEVHGHADKFCVTLCHPGVDPSVPIVILRCGRLSVVESADLGEGLLRLCEGSLSQAQLWQWLATPGQAIAADLPYREYI